MGPVSYAQLFQQPNQYRGRLVTVSGRRATRASRGDFFPNDYGFKEYYQIWLWPDDNPSAPMVIYSLELPKGFPTGMEIGEQAEVTGFFFKRLAYLAKDTLRVAPEILAKTVQWQKRPAITADEPAETWPIPLVVCVAAGLALLAAWFVYYPHATESPGVAGSAAELRRSYTTWTRRNRKPIMASQNSVSSASRRLFCIVIAIAGAVGLPADSRAAATKKPNTPQEMFRVLGVEDSYFDRLADGKPLDKGEDESLLRVLFRLRLFPRVDLERWAENLDAPDALPSGRDQRGSIFRLRGRV